MSDIKKEFLDKLKDFSKELTKYVSDKVGEKVFDEYWINQGVLKVPDPKKVGNFKKLTKLTEFLEFKGMSSDKINPMKPKRKNKK